MNKIPSIRSSSLSVRQPASFSTITMISYFITHVVTDVPDVQTFVILSHNTSSFRCFHRKHLSCVTGPAFSTAHSSWRSHSELGEWIHKQTAPTRTCCCSTPGAPRGTICVPELPQTDSISWLLWYPSGVTSLSTDSPTIDPVAAPTFNRMMYFLFPSGYSSFSPAAQACQVFLVCWDGTGNRTEPAAANKLFQ